MSRILIVDDDNRILNLLQQFLQRNGFAVATASSAQESLEILSNNEFDLIILDVMMPEVTGIEFAKNMRQQENNIPIMMLTALSDPEDQLEGLQAGASDYMTKPFNPQELLLRINNLLQMDDAYKNQ